MSLKGKTSQEIVSFLNDPHIITPSQYLQQNNKEEFSIVSKKWNIKILDYIIQNENYTEMLVQNKKTRVNHKAHNIVRVAEEECIKYKNNHEAIIDENFSESRADYEVEMKKVKLIEIDKKINMYNNLLGELVNDYKEDIILQEDFENYNKDYMYKLNNLKKEKENLEKKNISKKNIDWIKK